MKRALAIVLCCGGGAPVAQAARPWPDATGQIVVFADQLPSDLTAAQRQFAATRLAGTQKQRRSDLAALRAYNPDLLCLHYQLAVGSGPHAFIDGNAWTSDWWFVDLQTNWFLLNAQTQRVHQSAWDWDVMDIGYSNGVPRTGFPGYWMTTCLDRIRSAANDGVFADSFTQDACFDQCSPSHPVFTDVAACLSGWLPHLQAYGRAVRAFLEADTNGFLFLPNLGSLVNGWDPTDYGLGHGGMIEGFCFFDSANHFALEDWTLQMQRAIELARSNKVVICQSTPDTGNYQDRMYAVASHLLVKGRRTYLNLLTTGDVALEYYPEYTLPLGALREPVPPPLTNLWHAPWGVYRREFERGLALVNPRAAAVAIPDLGARYFLAAATGGGGVDETGHEPGSLSYTPVTSLLLAAESGAVLLSSTNGGPPGTNPAWKVSGLAGFHRSGQTFLTWNEVCSPTGVRYAVYRHRAPLAATNLAGAERLAVVPRNSARFYAGRYDSDAGWRTRYSDRLAVEPGAGGLAPGKGLLVWTPSTNDFDGGHTGAAYYAVTVVDPQGVEETNVFDPGNLVGPLGEGVADPLPVELTNYPAVAGGGRVHVYLQYMNLREWNPTFHAPHAGNGYYGLAPDDAVTQALQYAYDYAVAEPACATTPAPVYVNLHGWGGNTYGPVTSDPEPYDWCAYKIFPVDVSETWFFGFARTNDYRRGDRPQAGDTIVNYTEQRVLRMIYDLLRQPPGPAADPERVYAWGHSMGGSGALALALRYPRVFAAVMAGEPMTDYRASGDGGGTDWREDVAWKWGGAELDLPVLSSGPGNWAAPLQAYNGRGAWSWQNHQSNLAARAGDDLVPLGIAHGLNDTVIEWTTQGRGVYPALDDAGQCWGGLITDTGHAWLGFDACPATLEADASAIPFQAFRASRSESVPGWRRSDDNGPLPPDAPTEFHQAIAWSASWDPWDGPPVDTPEQWRMSLRSLNGHTHTVDIIPRRLQRFPHAPGTRALWRNTPILATQTVQIGVLAADGFGRYILHGVRVTPAGTRLQLDLDQPGDSDADSLPDGWEEAFFGSPTQALPNADPDSDGASNAEEYRAGTHPLNGASVFRVEALTRGRLAWSSTPGFVYVPAQAVSPALDWTPAAPAVTAAAPESSCALPAPAAELRWYRVQTPTARK